VVAPRFISRGHKLGGEPQRRKAFGGESAEPVHTVTVTREAVDADHLPQHLKGGRHLTLEEFVQRSSVLHGLRVARIVAEVNCENRNAPANSVVH
jgi:hypothetical protein